MSPLRDRFGLFSPEYPVDRYGCLPKGRQLFLISKKLARSRSKSWEIAYSNNIKGRRYVLWRLDEQFWHGTLLDHKEYWYFECALLKKDEEYSLKSTN